MACIVLGNGNVVVILEHEVEGYPSVEAYESQCEEEDDGVDVDGLRSEQERRGVVAGVGGVATARGVGSAPIDAAAGAGWVKRLGHDFVKNDAARIKGAMRRG